MQGPRSMLHQRVAGRLGGEPIDHARKSVTAGQPAAEPLRVERELLVGAGAARENPAAKVDFPLAAEFPSVVADKVQHLVQHLPDRLCAPGRLVDEAAMDAVSLRPPAVLVVDRAGGAGWPALSFEFNDRCRRDRYRAAIAIVSSSRVQLSATRSSSVGCFRDGRITHHT